MIRASVWQTLVKNCRGGCEDCMNPLWAKPKCRVNKISQEWGAKHQSRTSPYLEQCSRKILSWAWGWQQFHRSVFTSCGQWRAVTLMDFTAEELPGVVLHLLVFLLVTNLWNQRMSLPKSILGHDVCDRCQKMLLCSRPSFLWKPLDFNGHYWMHAEWQCSFYWWSFNNAHVAMGTRCHGVYLMVTLVHWGFCWAVGSSGTLRPADPKEPLSWAMSPNTCPSPRLKTLAGACWPHLRLRMLFSGFVLF